MEFLIIRENIMKILTHNKGMILTIDIMNALIILTVLLGLTAQIMDNLSYKIGENSYTSSLDRISSNTADILINTPGSPEDWEERTSYNDVSPGLAKVNSNAIHSPVISYKKLIKLRDNYQSLVVGKVLPKGIKSSLILYPADPSLEIIEINKEPLNLYAADLYQVNKTVLLDRTYPIIVSIYPNITKNQICPHQQSGTSNHFAPNYSSETPGWICHNFLINSTLINDFDFYLMTSPEIISDNNARWLIDNPQNMSENMKNFGTTPQNINSEIEIYSSSNNTSILWLHVFTSAKQQDVFETHIVAVPKGTSSSDVKIQYVNPNPYYFILKIWI
jgi:hypothetical protein